MSGTEDQPKKKRSSKATRSKGRGAAEIRAEEQLRKSEERFRRYFELGLIGIAITSPSKGIVEVNDEICKILGYERSELLQLTWAELTHPDDLASDVEKFNRVLAGEIDGYSMDKRWIRKDGRLIDAAISVKCLRLPDGSIDYFVALLQDVTERKRAEEALRASEERLHLLIESAKDYAIMTLDNEGHISGWNAGAVRMFGYTEAEIIGHPGEVLFTPEDRERGSLPADMRQTKDEGRAEEEHDYLRKDGTRFFGSGVLAVLRDHNGQGYLKIIRDLTQRKHAEDRLRRAQAELEQRVIERTKDLAAAYEKLAASEQRFRLLLASIPQLVWSVRIDGSDGYWNQQLIDYTGLTTEELQQGGWAGGHPDEVERVRAAWLEALSKRTLFEQEQRLRGRDDRYRRFLCRAVPVPNETGQVLEWFGTATDIEDLRQAEEALQDMRTELAHMARVSTMGELVASVAHEVNQPLTAVVADGTACIHWLDRHPPNLHEANEALTRIINEANRAGQVISRIRTFLKRSPTENVRLSVNDLIRDTIALIGGELSKKQIVLQADLAADLPAILGDRIQLQQVILNLLMNAIEAVAAKSEGTRQIVISSENQPFDQILIAVRDSGMGIDRASVEQLFRPFVTTKAGGMGIGLSISRSIVEGHGGRLWATPDEREGATFQFSVPVVVAARGAGEVS